MGAYDLFCQRYPKQSVVQVVWVGAGNSVSLEPAGPGDRMQTRTTAGFFSTSPDDWCGEYKYSPEAKTVPTDASNVLRR